MNFKFFIYPSLLARILRTFCSFRFEFLNGCKPHLQNEKATQNIEFYRTENCKKPITIFSAGSRCNNKKKHPRLSFFSHRQSDYNILRTQNFCISMVVFVCIVFPAFSIVFVCKIIIDHDGKFWIDEKKKRASKCEKERKS